MGVGNPNSSADPLAQGFYQAALDNNLPTELDPVGLSGVNTLGASYILPSGQARRGLLIELVNESALKNLLPGNDRPNGGSSNAPYIYSRLPEYSTPLEKFSLDAAKYSFDFPVRGGALALVNSAKDFIRIGKFLVDEPKGPLFITKQVLLQLSNPKIETGKVLGIENTRLYNLGLNTLAQVPVNAFGVHLDRSGLLFSIKDEDKYYSIVSKKRTEDNRLVVLKNQKIVFDPTYFYKASKLGISTTSDHQIIDYWGGPNSTLGILGRTTIRRVVDTGDDAFKYNAAADSIINNNTDVNGYLPTSKYYSFLNSTYVTLTDNTKGKIKEDFRAIINREVLGGEKKLLQSDYTSGDAKTVENTGNSINFSSIIKALNGDNTISELEKDKDYRDQIKFRFETINTSNPNNPFLLFFRAFLTSFTDSVTADWQSFKYTGRGENFYTYNGFGRTINFGFKVAALNEAEMKPLYTKLNYLVANLAPVYDTIFMSGPLMRITVGDYIYRQPGFFTSLNLSIDENTPWETNLEENEDKYQLPHVINVDASFTPIHSFLVRRYESAPFITPPGSNNKWLQNPIQER